MIHFDLPKEKSSIIKVIGIGGGGSNAVNHMYSQNIEGVNFIICNTDAQAIHQSNVPNKIQLGPHLTQGLGAGANPEIGRQATEESLEEIKRILEVNTKMAFVTAGMGGGTGTGGAPIISKICKDLGILTVGIVTTPFSYEGKKRQQQAEDGIKNLKQYVDTLLVISNDKLRHQFGNLKMREAFSRADNVLATAAKCITDVILGLGYDNNLGSKIGITLIATGFQFKDPFSKREAPKPESKKDDKIVMTLGEQPSPKPQATIPQEPKIEDLLAPRLIDEDAITEIPMPQMKDAQLDLHFNTTNFVEKEEEESAPVHLHLKIKDEKEEAEDEKKELERKKQWLDDRFEKLRQSVLASNNNIPTANQNNSQASAASGGYLARPSNIYAESKPEVFTSKPAEEPVPAPVAKVDESEIIDMQLVIRNDIPAADEATSPQTQTPKTHADELALPDAAEDQKRRAADRLQKLRNLSFNINAADPNNEFEAVPAYIRRNMELFNNSSTVENFYSKYEIRDNGDGKGANISTINTFLDGKKPD